VQEEYEKYESEEEKTEYEEIEVEEEYSESEEELESLNISSWKPSSKSMMPD